MKTEVMSFRKSAIANGREVLKERTKDRGRVSEVRVRFYPGAEKALVIMPYVLHKNNRREDFFTYAEGSDKYITGDNDYLVFPCSVDFDYDDEIAVEYRNTSTVYEYSVSVDVIVNYHVEEAPINA